MDKVGLALLVLLMFANLIWLGQVQREVDNIRLQMVVAHPAKQYQDFSEGENSYSLPEGIVAPERTLHND